MISLIQLESIRGSHWLCVEREGAVDAERKHQVRGEWAKQVSVLPPTDEKSLINVHWIFKIKFKSQVLSLIFELKVPENDS